MHLFTTRAIEKAREICRHYRLPSVDKRLLPGAFKLAMLAEMERDEDAVLNLFDLYSRNDPKLTNIPVWRSLATLCPLLEGQLEPRALSQALSALAAPSLQVDLSANATSDVEEAGDDCQCHLCQVWDSVDEEFGRAGFPEHPMVTPMLCSINDMETKLQALEAAQNEASGDETA